MAKERIDAGKAPHVHIAHCDGDLAVQGWAEPALQLAGEYVVEETEKGYRMTCSGDLRLRVPTGGSVYIEQVSGDAAVKHLTGVCAIDRVHGDAVLVDLGRVEVNVIHGDLVVRGAVEEVSVGEIHGDLSARNTAAIAIRAAYGDLVARRATGSVSVQEASGDVDLRFVGGDVTVDQARRDVNLAYVEGRLAVADVQGDVRLRGGLPAGEHSISARGDVVVRWPAASPLTLVANGKRIDSRLPLEDAAEADGSLTGRIAGGDARLNIAAGGRVILKEMEMVDEKWEGYGAGEGDFGYGAAFGRFSLDNLGARIEAEINSHLARVTRDVESRFGPEFGQRMAEKFARQAERTAERTRRRPDMGRRSGAEFAAGTASRKAASPEEQLKILKMVEAGTISPEEAGMLLEALGG